MNYPAPSWPLRPRHFKLPQWAQEEIHRLLCGEINREAEDCLQGDIRRAALRTLGGHCTFADDDLHLLVLLAEAAIDAGLHCDLVDRKTITNIEEAKIRRDAERAKVASAIEARRAETAETGSVHESAGPKDDAQPQVSTPLNQEGKA